MPKNPVAAHRPTANGLNRRRVSGHSVVRRVSFQLPPIQTSVFQISAQLFPALVVCVGLTHPDGA